MCMYIYIYVCILIYINGGILQYVQSSREGGFDLIVYASEAKRVLFIADCFWVFSLKMGQSYYIQKQIEHGTNLIHTKTIYFQ